MSHEAIAGKFDEWAESGNADRLEQAHGDVVAQVLETMDIQAGEKILDLGCGNGWATRLLAKAAPGTQAIGVDASPGMIARADELHSFTIRARYDLGTFEELEFPDGHFDRAFSMEALYYSPDVEQALAELVRVLKPGGQVDIIIDRYKGNPASERWAELMGMPLEFRSEQEWKATFEAAGLSDVVTSRVVDRRGPGDEADFEPGAHHASWEEKCETHGNGSLWLHAAKPSG